jgi:hypothetical protein
MKIEAYCNTPDEKLLENVAINSKRSIPWIVQEEAHDLHAVLIGGGPSVSEWLHEIKARQSAGQTIFALNGAARWLRENGVVPDYCVVVDARDFNTSFLNLAKQDLLASQCHPCMFEVSKNVVLWHQEYPDMMEKFDACLPGNPAPHALIGGGTTVGLSSMALAYAMGYRFMHLYGYDSSYREDSLHVYKQDDPQRSICDVTAYGKVFKTTIAMAKQAELFQELANSLIDLGCMITIRGDGLLPWISENAAKQKSVLTACYDLAVSPPTYDFISFLVEAEKARVQGGFDCLDIIFQPGPKEGFREDNLPPSVDERKSMLQRICVPACRFLESVRNVEILADRKAIEGFVFPAGWSDDSPVNHYGTRYFKTFTQCLTASKYAKKRIAQDFSRYITITLRKCDYWPERNSNLNEWIKVANKLSEEYHVVFVPDTNDKDPIGYIPASWDIDLRLALYEGAVVNLMVANGPLPLCIASKSPHIVFKMITDSCVSTTEEFLLMEGVEIGDQYCSHGMVVWENDNSEAILKAVDTFLSKPYNSGSTQLLEVM